jgi:predicted small metal-binding protein
MYTLACKDFGIDCDFVAKDETTNGVVEKAKAHSAQAHPEAAAKMKEMGVTPSGARADYIKDQERGIRNWFEYE